jgi:hypothetical protein
MTTSTAVESAPTVQFRDFPANVNARYNQLSVGELFVVKVENIFEAYIAAFPEGTNPIFKERTEHDCNHCKNFIRNLGTTISITPDGTVLTVWDNHAELGYPYNVVGEALQKLVLEASAKVKGVFRSKERRYGIEHNHDAAGNKWHHFHGAVSDLHFNESPGEELGKKDAAAQVFRRGLEEFSLEVLESALDLIDGGLYRGEENRAIIVEFSNLQRRYQEATNKDAFVWLNTKSFASHIRNSAIGTLLIDLASGMDHEKAADSFGRKVDPANYKRPTSFITPKMIEAAMAKVDALGLRDSLERRFATAEDVSVNDVLFVDKDVRGRMRDSLTDALMSEAKIPRSKSKDAVAISGEDFLANVVPRATSIQLMLENRHLGNFVTLTAAVHKGAGRLFKWDSDVAWSYADEVTDAIKARVKAAGGRVDAVFCSRLGWYNYDDLDLHVRTPLGEHIHWANRVGSLSGGQLDVDMNAGGGHTREPVENIFFNDNIPDGVYRVEVNNYAKRESSNVGFELSVEFKGVIHSFQYARAVPDKRTVSALTITICKGEMVSILPGEGVIGGSAPTEKWGLTTGQAVTVDTIMLSPNYWGHQKGGNKHFFFFLRDAKNPAATRGIYNEFLRPEFEEHRKVFEVLGSKTRAPYSENQLSGVGFSSTRKDEVTVIVDGRPYHIKF